MKDLLKYSLISAMMFGAVSCADLDEEILDSYTEDFDPANPGVGVKNNVNKATPNDGLSGAFTRVLNGTANHGGYFSAQEVSSDEAVITQKGVTGLMEENGLLCIAISLPLPVRVDLKVLIMIPMVVFFSVMTF
ncbi:MAG: hypothetical protein IPK96_12865 [Flammeovirgaceae bacterium]|nr:hypothetical protein [Flammeovirgaceae bacterium]